jgi:hypothetical protein
MTTKNTPNQPSWGSWLRDGAQLIGLDQAQQDKLKAQTRELADKAADGITRLERGINGFEAKAKQRFQDWRKTSKQS